MGDQFDHLRYVAQVSLYLLRFVHHLVMIFWAREILAKHDHWDALSTGETLCLVHDTMRHSVQFYRKIPLPYLALQHLCRHSLFPQKIFQHELANDEYSINEI